MGDHLTSVLPTLQQIAVGKAHADEGVRIGPTPGHLCIAHGLPSVSHGDGKGRERETEIERDRDRDRDRETETETETETERNRERNRE